MRRRHCASATASEAVPRCERGAAKTHLGIVCCHGTEIVLARRRPRETRDPASTPHRHVEVVGQLGIGDAVRRVQQPLVQSNLCMARDAWGWPVRTGPHVCTRGRRTRVHVCQRMWLGRRCGEATGCNASAYFHAKGMLLPVRGVATRVRAQRAVLIAALRRPQPQVELDRQLVQVDRRVGHPLRAGPVALPRSRGN